jgi:tRNA-specific 2-thiouridylase
MSSQSLPARAPGAEIGSARVRPAALTVDASLGQDDQSHPNTQRETVVVALSGGLDSMVTALLLKERGHRVVALHMLLQQNDPPEPGEHLQNLANRLGIPLQAVELRQAFYRQVVTPFLHAYRQGKTPNPCVVCNPKIKFALLLEQALDLGATRLATGHYARLRVDEDDGRLRLFRARDRRKDQTYFLYGLNQSQLSQTIFPLGTYLKREVKQLAAAAGLTDCHRPESQEICFIPDNDYRRFLEQHLETELPASGPIVDQEGIQVGEHQGIHCFTIGQRRGLGIPSSAPYYVVGLEPETNTVRIGRESDLCRSELLVTEVNWLIPSPPTAPTEASVQIRSRHREAPAILEVTSRGVLVRFLDPQMAVTPGQAAVFYWGEEVIGGGTIDRVIS